MSQSIFTPGVYNPAVSKRKDILTDYKVEKRQNYSRGGTPHLKALQIDDKMTQIENQKRRRERLLKLKDEIRVERDLKASLKEQLKEIKRDMTTRLALVDIERKS
mgnify:CR=1 FL=1